MGLRNNYNIFTLPFIAILVFAVLAAYWPILDYPFFADDWHTLSYFSSHSNMESLKKYFLEFHVVASYRPMGYVYLLTLYNLFGLNHVAFNIVILLFHFMNCILFAYIVYKILNDVLIARLVGILYATSVKIYLYPLIWSATGFFDIGGTFFFLASFILFLKSRYGISALFFMIALFTKPPMGILPLILLAYIIFVPGTSDVITRRIRNLRFHFLIFFLYAAALFLTLIYFKKGEGYYPYVDFWGAHLYQNAFHYLSSYASIIFPLKEAILPYLVFVLFLVFLSLKNSSGITEHKKYNPIFWIIWFILGLAPLSIIEVKGPLYYASYAWPAFMVLFLLFVRGVAFRLRFDKKKVFLLIGATVLVSSFSSIAYSFLEDRKGIASEEKMIVHAYRIRTLRDVLLEAKPSLPKGAVLVFKDRDVYWILSERNLAVRTWYKDNAIEVCELPDLHASADGIWIELRQGPGIPYTWPGFSRIELDPERPFFLVSCGLKGRTRDVYVRELSLQELYALSAPTKKR